MKDSNARPRLLRFSVFEVDLRTGELHKQGLKVKLHGQPFQVLAMLLECPGELVTREEIREKLWPGETFIDFEHSVNSSIKRLREALGDDPAAPRFIETLSRHGYRFIAPVEPRTPGPSTLGRRWSAGPGEGAFGGGAIHESPLRRHWVVAAAGGLVVAVVAVLLSLNVAGLREPLLTSVGVRRAVPFPKIESIAVLPLENLSRDPEQDYFTDGMTEALIAELGQIGSLRVISRTSVMRFKGARPQGGLQEIARQLKVDALIEGSVLRSGERVRVTAELIDAKTDRQLWARNYERDLRDVLALQGDVARAIAGEIKIKLSPQEETHLASARPVNPEAYELYLKGRYEWNKRTEEGLDKGLEYFQQAIRADPNYALPYCGMADTYAALGLNTILPGEEVYPKANAAALKALELDDSLAEAHASLAMALVDYDRDWSTAEREFQRAIELNPSYATAHHWYALTLAWIGRSDEAIAEIEEARTLDPLSVRISGNVGVVLYLARQYDRAIPEGLRALELEPGDPNAHWILGQTYLQKRMNREALAELQKEVSLEHTYPGGLTFLAHAYAATGHREEASKILGDLRELSKRRYVSPYGIATIYVGLGDRDEAFAWLQKGLDVHDGWMGFLKVDPKLDPLRSDPRFQDLLRRMNFPP